MNHITGTDKGAKNKSEPLLKFTLFANRPKVGKYSLNPLTGGRMAVLEEKKNVLACGVKEGAEVDSFTVYECFLVAILSGEELAELSLLEPNEWKLKVRGWSMDVDDELVNTFWEIFNGELDAAKAAQTKPRKKPVPRAGRGR